MTSPEHDRSARPAGPRPARPRSTGPEPADTGTAAPGPTGLSAGLAALAGGLLHSLRKRPGDADGPAVRSVTQDELTYTEVIAFFTGHRAASGGARAGTVLRSPRRGGHLVHLHFVDGSSTPLPNAPSAVYRVRRLDAELTAAFGPNDLIVIS
ncbi:hypothetical protein ACFCX4_26395 [Kitasatospora sp. NPDC056327]|uniref:hypothetical protein n=1 Tax=Kitasatospora sp. NPDC056327 TaxID=3345785 RepID=UPI0035D81290